MMSRAGNASFMLNEWRRREVLVPAVQRTKDTSWDNCGTALGVRETAVIVVRLLSDPLHHEKLDVGNHGQHIGLT